eukprot:11011980-Alexandrium_andersonii.AAC.1
MGPGGGQVSGRRLAAKPSPCPAVAWWSSAGGAFAGSAEAGVPAQLGPGGVGAELAAEPWLGPRAWARGAPQRWAPPAAAGAAL